MLPVVKFHFQRGTMVAKDLNRSWNDKRYTVFPQSTLFFRRAESFQPRPSTMNEDRLNCLSCEYARPFFQELA